MSPADLGYVLSAALRYQLPRQTYGSAIVADVIVSHWHHLYPADRQRIVREIETALADPRGAGDKCDRDSWRLVLEHARAHP
jgi:hypothetical protein